MTEAVDYLQRVAEEVSTLKRDLSVTGTREAIEKVARRLSLADDVALAALYRAARRSGYDLALMARATTEQLDREARTSSGPDEPADAEKRPAP